MLKHILLTLFFVLFASPAFAGSGPWGIGVIINSPTGFSVKHRISSKNSIDGALGYSFGRSDNISIHSTYLWEFNEKIKISKINLSYYLGIGGALHSRDKNDDPPRWAADNSDDELGLAVRGVGGLNYYFKDPAFEVFAELSLNFFFVPATDVNLGIAVGGRYYF